MVGLKFAIHEVLKVWNDNVKAQEINIEYLIEVHNRKKKYYINKVDFYTLDISELRFISKGDENLLLWRKELQVPEKVKGVPKHQIYSNYEDQLYKYFLYECIGIFGMTCSESIKAKDYAPYDIDKDRLVANIYFKDHVIEATEDGAFFKKGDTFDVFNELEGGWAIFTAHEVGIPNNGIAKIDKTKCKVVVETAQKIELIKPKKSKLILPPHLQNG